MSCQFDSTDRSDHLLLPTRTNKSHISRVRRRRVTSKNDHGQENVQQDRWQTSHSRTCSRTPISASQGADKLSSRLFVGAAVVLFGIHVHVDDVLLQVHRCVVPVLSVHIRRCLLQPPPWCNHTLLPLSSTTRCVGYVENNITLLWLLFMRRREEGRYCRTSSGG